MNNNIYMDLHVIQTMPPSNINRDDTGSPKTAQYGGVTRARVSSQSWKKAMRDYFKEHAKKDSLGIRTKRIVATLASAIMAEDESYDESAALELAEEIIKKGEVFKKENVGKVLFFLGKKQRNHLAVYGIQKSNNLKRKEIQEILQSNQSIDIALFGRMVADAPALNVDASAQVAHSISTHKVATEFDFFTAVDDLVSDDESGAGMLGTVEYNSSTLYRYANVAVHALNAELKDSKDVVIDMLKLFIRSFVLSLPTGKINTFANQTLPEVLVVAIRRDRPVNLVSAFESPVKAQEGYVDGSISKLEKEFDKIARFVDEPYATFMVGDISIKGENKKTLNELLIAIGETLEKLL